MIDELDKAATTTGMFDTLTPRQTAMALMTDVAQKAIMAVLTEAGCDYAAEYVLDAWTDDQAQKWQEDGERVQLEWLTMWVDDSIDDRGPADLAEDFARQCGEQHARRRAELAPVRFVAYTPLGYHGSGRIMVSDEFGNWKGSATTTRGMDMVIRRCIRGPATITLAGPWVRLHTEEAVRVVQTSQAVYV